MYNFTLKNIKVNFVRKLFAAHQTIDFKILLIIFTFIKR